MEGSRVLTCQALTEEITDYDEGHLSPLRRVEFHLHVAICPHCRVYVRQMKQTIEALHALTHESAPPAASDELLSQFRSQLPHAQAPNLSPLGALRLLSRLDSLGSRRGRASIGLMMLAALAATLAVGLVAGPLGDGWRCLLLELGSAGVAAGVLAALVWRTRARLAASTWAMVAMAGAFAGFAALELTCALAHAAPHVMAYHLGGLLLTGALAGAAARLMSSS